LNFIIDNLCPFLYTIYMVIAKELIEKIEPRMAEIRAALSADERAAFEKGYYALTDALTAGEDSKNVAVELKALLYQYPPAAELLGLEKAPAEGIPAAEIPPSNPLSQGDIPMVPPTLPTTPPDSRIASPARQGFKAEDLITFFKEVVTAIIALLLVWTTVRIAASLLGFVGDATRMAQAKDVLGTLTGLLGVVMGYYFGRMPAEARAAQAQEQVAQATAVGEQAKAHSEAIGARAEELADQAGKLATQMQSIPVARGQVNPTEELQRWQSDVEELRRLARGR
jgi:hypothetical protein